ncbi:MAG: DUF3368 domain-containing protein [Terriglobia bacterium]
MRDAGSVPSSQPPPPTFAPWRGRTIALALDLHADETIIDEQEGRELAAQAGIHVVGVLGILLRAKRLGQIPALKPEIQSLRTKANFFIAPLLEAKVLAAAGE